MSLHRSRRCRSNWSPANDAFPDEKEAEEIRQRLAQFGQGLREHLDRAATLADALLAPQFKGGRLSAATSNRWAAAPQLEILRSSGSSCGSRRRSRIVPEGAERGPQRLRLARDGRVPGDRDRGEARCVAIGADHHPLRSRGACERRRTRPTRRPLAHALAGVAGRGVARHRVERARLRAITRSGGGVQRCHRRRAGAQPVVRPASSCPASTTGRRISTRCSRRAAWAITASRSATSTATASTTSTWRSRTACRTGCSATPATARSRTSPRPRASRCSIARRSRSSPTSTTTATRI